MVKGKKRFFILGFICLLFSCVTWAQEQTAGDLSQWHIGEEKDIWIPLANTDPFAYDELGYILHPDYQQKENQIIEELYKNRNVWIKNDISPLILALSAFIDRDIQSQMHGFARCMQSYPKEDNLEDPVYLQRFVPSSLVLESYFYPAVTSPELKRNINKLSDENVYPINPLYRLNMSYIYEAFCSDVISNWKNCDWAVVKGKVSDKKHRLEQHGFSDQSRGQYQSTNIYMNYLSHHFICGS